MIIPPSKSLHDVAIALQNLRFYVHSLATDHTNYEVKGNTGNIFIMRCSSGGNIFKVA